ncbi:MAG: dihydropteroate synthase [Gammaproteobacteria bacterium]|nr:dihydropteroate synthase [Gammaproteobacteria bacterium]
MGILNVTPDSFSDGGRFDTLPAAIDQAARMVAQGADLLDIGGESTRPGAGEVPEDAELERVVPVIERLRSRFECELSVDTSKPRVMTEAVAAGATMINDVCALQVEGAVETAARLGVPVCLMHMQGRPRTMQSAPAYEDVTAEVGEFLAGRMRACVDAGMPADALLVDPGFGFGKTIEHNLQLLRDLDRIAMMGVPVLVGLSRKSMIGALLDRPVDERLHASVALALLAAQKGAAIVRVHDVGPTVDALRIWEAVDRRESDRERNIDG